MPHCNLLSLLGAAIVFISCSLHCCQAHSRNLVNKDLCRSLDVQHELLDPVADDSVVVQLTNASGAVATCYQKSTIYNVTIKAHKSVYGLIMVQDPDKKYGTFPYIKRRDKIRLPSGLVSGFCENTPSDENLSTFENIPSVTHKCNYESDHEYETKCNLGSTLNIPFKAPSSGENLIELRYSIVFSRNEFLEDRSVSFIPCSASVATTTPTTPAPTEMITVAQLATEIPYNPICNVTGLKVNDSIEEAPMVCGPNNPSMHFKELRRITENNMNYTCELEHRLKTCETGCTKDGKPACCRVKVHKIIQRMFNCTPDDPEASIITRRFNVTSQKKCECFFCEDLCPAPPTDSSTESMDEGGNSVELEYVMEEGDVNKDNPVELKESPTPTQPPGISTAAASGTL